MLGLQGAVSLRREQPEPFAVDCMSDHVWRTAVTGKEFAIVRDVEVDGPLVALKGIANFVLRSSRRKEALIFPRLGNREPPYVGCYASQIEFLAAWNLQIEPNPLAI